MDERFKGRGLWVGFGALAIVLLCLMMCGFGAMFTMSGARAPVYVQPPAVEEGAVPPPATYGHSPSYLGPHGATGPFGFLLHAIGGFFKLAFLGLLFLLLLGLVKRVFFGHRFWGPRHWSHIHGGPHYRGKPPQGTEWKGGPHGMWGPWAWHCHGHYGESEDEPPGEEGESDAGSDSAEYAYSGPQE
jgi:hypothetical protein